MDPDCLVLVGQKSLIAIKNQWPKILSRFPTIKAGDCKLQLTTCQTSLQTRTSFPDSPSAVTSQRQVRKNCWQVEPKILSSEVM